MCIELLGRVEQTMARGVRHSSTDLIGCHEDQSQQNNPITDRRKLNNLNELITLNADHHGKVSFKMSELRRPSTTRRRHSQTRVT